MNGVVRIEFNIVNGQLQIMVNAPMQNQEQKNLTIQVLAAAIPIVANYQEPAIHTNGAPKLIVPKLPTTH